MLVLGLMLVLRFLELFNGLLELQKSLIMVFFGLILLSLKEVEFSLPEGFFLVEFRLEFSMLLLHIIVLALPVLNLLPDTKLTLREGLVELLVLLLKLLILNFIRFDKIFLLSL